MKIAISMDNGNVAEHFGRCKNYTIVEIKDNKIINKKIIKNPRHEPGYIPKFLHNLKVEYVIAGGVGQRAINLFNEFDMKIIFAQGKVDEIINKFLKNKLKSEESLCNH